LRSSFGFYDLKVCGVSRIVFFSLTVSQVLEAWSIVSLSEVRFSLLVGSGEPSLPTSSFRSLFHFLFDIQNGSNPTNPTVTKPPAQTDNNRRALAE
jgi:hypothetical protein